MFTFRFSPRATSQTIALFFALSAQRGYKVIVPIDCMSSEDPYMEQYAAWHMFKGGPAIVTTQTTLTRSDMIKF
jgi:nicotinamidase-related amidase